MSARIVPRLSAAAAILAAMSGWAAPPLAEVPPTGRAVLYPDTVLVETGAAACVIVHPARDPAMAAAAARLADGLRARYGVPFPLAPDEAVCPAHRAPVAEPFQHRNLILLGNVYNNRAILPLYAGFWCGADGAYPGGAGFVLRTVSNPWGTGKNCVLLGASTPAGADRGVAALLDRLPAAANGRTIRLPRLLEVVPGGDMVGIVSTIVARADGYVIRYPENLFHEPVDAFAGPAFRYHWTGDRRWAEIARKILLHIDAHYDLGYYSVSHYRFERFFRAWDIIEESGGFSDEEVQRLARRMAETAFRAPGCQLRGPVRAGGDRHATAGWMSAFIGSDYLRRTFPDAAPAVRQQADQWRQWADATFAYAVTGRDDDDRYSSQDTAEMFLRWSLLAGRPEYVDSGMARQALVFFLSYFDPLGYSCGLADYGDAVPEAVYSQDHGVRYQVNLLGYACQDPRCAWLARNVPVCGRGRTYFGPNIFGGLRAGSELERNECHFEPPATWGSDAKAPGSMMGLVALPVDARRWEERRARGVRLPDKDAALDKVWFRSGFGPNDSYLMLQGLQTFQDANTIPRFVDRGQVWLFHNTQERGTFYRNGLYVSDGLNQAGTTTVYACRADNLARFDDLALSRSTIAGVMGVDWTRTVVWRPGNWFLVLDHAVPLTSGTYAVTCTWRLLHPAVWEQDRCLTARAGLAEFYLKSAAPIPATVEQWETLESSACPCFLRQMQAGLLQAGETVDFQNLLYAGDPGDPRRVEPVRIDPWTVLVREAGGGAALVGIGTGNPNALGIAANPECVYAAISNRLFLSRARRVAFGTTVVFAAETPATVAINLDAGTGRAGLDAAALFAAAATWSLPAPGREASVPGAAPAGAAGWLRGALARVAGPLLYAPRRAGAPESLAAGRVALVPAARNDQATRVPRRVRGLRLSSPKAIGEPALAVDGTKEPTLRSVLTWPDGVRPDLTVAWNRPERIRELLLAFYGWPEGGPRFVAPAARPPIRVMLSTDGTAGPAQPVDAAQERFPIYKISNKGDAGAMGCLVLDLGGAPASAVRLTLPFGASGYVNLKEFEVLSAEETGASLDAVETGDLDGDGRPELLATFQDARGRGVLKVFGEDARERWAARADGAFTRAVAADVDGDGRAEVLATAADYSVRVLAADGSVLWKRTMRGLKQASNSREWPYGEAPTGIGLWEPKPGLKRMIVGGYCHLALLDPATGEIVGSRHFENSRYVWKILEQQPDLDGDGVREAILLHWINSSTPGDANILRLKPDGSLGTFCYAMLIPDGRFAAELTVDTPPRLAVIGPRGFGLFQTDTKLTGMALYTLPLWRHIYTRPISAGALADLDGAGRKDFVVGGRDGFLTVLHGADGTLRARVALGKPVLDVLAFGAGPAALLAVNTGDGILLCDGALNPVGTAAGAYGRLVKLRDAAGDRTLAAFGRDGALTILRVTP